MHILLALTLGLSVVAQARSPYKTFSLARALILPIALELTGESWPRRTYEVRVVAHSSLRYFSTLDRFNTKFGKPMTPAGVRVSGVIKLAREAISHLDETHSAEDALPRVIPREGTRELFILTIPGPAGTRPEALREWLDETERALIARYPALKAPTDLRSVDVLTLDAPFRRHITSPAEQRAFYITYLQALRQQVKGTLAWPDEQKEFVERKLNVLGFSLLDVTEAEVKRWEGALKRCASRLSGPSAKRPRLIR